MKNQKSTLGYYEVLKGASDYKEILKEAKRTGYNFLFRWINSDQSWTFFQTTYLKAEKAAIELYMKEKKELNKKHAKKYYSEYVDIVSVSDELYSITNN